MRPALKRRAENAKRGTVLGWKPVQESLMAALRSNPLPLALFFWASTMRKTLLLGLSVLLLFVMPASADGESAYQVLILRESIDLAVALKADKVCPNVTLGTGLMSEGRDISKASDEFMDYVRPAAQSVADDELQKMGLANFCAQAMKHYGPRGDRVRNGLVSGGPRVK